MKFQEFQSFPKIANLPIHEQMRIFNTHVAYGQSGGRIFSFKCSGDGYGRFSISGISLVYIMSSTGYITVKRTDGSLFIYGDGDTSTEMFIVESIAGNYCFWSSDLNGEKLGTVTNIRSLDDGGFLTEMDMLDLNGLENSSFSENLSITSIILPSSMISISAIYFSGPKIDLSKTNIQYIDFSYSSITEIIPPITKSLISVNFSNCNLSNEMIDVLIMSMDTSHVGGYLNISGGSNAVPTTQSSLDILDSVLGSPMIISGSGDSNVNGEYFISGSTNGRDTYQNTSSGVVLYWNGSDWEIDSDDIYRSSDDVPFPWEISSWSVFVGVGPVPSSVTELIPATWTILTN